MMETIEYKYNEDISVYFTPLETGSNKYQVIVHDFCNMDKNTAILQGHELTEVLENPVEYLREFRFNNLFF